MSTTRYEYQSDFAKHYLTQGRNEGRNEGRAEGRNEGRAEMLVKLLEIRFGEVPATAKQQLLTASVEVVEAMAERVLSAKTLNEALGRG